MKPYYEDDLVKLYHGDCLEVTEWLAADVLVTDPPYGRAWRAGKGLKNGNGQGGGSVGHAGIAGDRDSSVRDAVLALWEGTRPAIVFGDLLIPSPTGTQQVLIYAKSLDAGIRGARGGFRRDAEAIYLVGDWPAKIGGESSIIRTSALVAGPTGGGAQFGHPHVKPQDVLLKLIVHCPPGIVADPFAGSGSTLVAAKALGRYAIGVELEERYCETAARRLAQGVFNFAEIA